MIRQIDLLSLKSEFKRMRICSKEGCSSVVFGTDKKTRKGFCKNHQYLRTDTDKRSILQKAISKNATKNETSKVRGLINEDVNLELVNKKKELDVWFDYHMNNSKKVCENCGADLKHYSRKDWYGSQHHVLEKSIFHSVKTNLDNHLVLGRWCCHPQWHTSMLNASKMKIFPKAEEIVNKLYPLLKNEEQGRISEYFKIKKNDFKSCTR